MIRFDQVSKRYEGGHEALSQLSFEVAAGEMAFITGHSGAGKSTLLKLLGLIERPSHGVITLDGQNMAKIGRTGIPKLRRRLGMVFQDHRLLMDRTVFANVELPLMIGGMAPSERSKRVRAALEKVGLLAYERQLPNTLSAGEQQRVGIARAIVAKPMLLIADEPTGNLDPHAGGGDHGPVRRIPEGRHHGAHRQPRPAADQAHEEARGRARSRPPGRRHCRAGGAVSTQPEMPLNESPLLSETHPRNGRGRARPVASWREHHGWSASASLRRLMSRPVGTLLTVAVMAIALALPLTFYLLLGNLQKMGDALGQNQTISAFLQPGQSAQAAQLMAKKLRDEAVVATVTVKSPQQGMDELAKMQGFSGALHTLDNNPLPYVLEVLPKPGVSADSVDQLVADMRSMQGVDQVQDSGTWRQRLEALLGVGQRAC